MKTKFLLAALTSILFFSFTFAQQTLTPAQWDNAKKNGQIDGKAVISLRAADDTTTSHYRMASNYPLPQPASNTCACWQQRDATWNTGDFDGSGGSGGPGIFPDYRNDDWTTPIINLPFNFCLYGTTWTQCYINNNGNVSFGAPYSTFTATGFPNASFVMVAPFWGDVDTRNLLSGLVYYKITPTYMVVQWDSVGYYGMHADKRNTFQMIMTNGTDPIVPGGNVSFCYKDMQWTTGDASGGVNGFGGSDAVVGANKGDGVNYIQFGEFNQPGSTYNGPANPGSGIDWLDNQSFIFDACANNNNVPPTASGIQVCDTLHLCVGDSLPLNVTFFSPEVGQITVITIDTTGTTGYNIISNSSGNTATLISYFLGSSSNLGYHTITITATDNGTPAGVTNIPIVIDVGFPPVTTITPDTTVCNGPVQLNVTGGGTYQWTPTTGLSCGTCSNPTANPAVTTTYIVTVTNGCPVDDTVTVFAPPVITLSPDTSMCSGISYQMNVSGGTSYTWAPAGTLNNANIANPIATPTVTTTYTVTVVNGNFASCTRVDSVTVTVIPTPVAVASNDTTICNGSFASLVSSGGTTYSWTPAGTLSNPNIASPFATPTVTTTYTVIVSNGTCTDTEPVTVNVQTPNANAGPDATICIGETTPLNASGGVAYSWSPAAGLSCTNCANPVASPTVTTNYTVTITDGLGCIDTDVMTVTVNPQPTAAFLVNPSVTFIDSVFTFTDQSTGGVNSWSWSFGDGNTSTLQDPQHSYTVAGTYNICLVTTDNSGCSDTTCWSVEVKPHDIEVPNVFTPNGDNTNDLLVFKNLEYFPNSMLQIYNRWGELVYENGNYLNDWNGKKKGNGGECVDGTYYYILSGPNIKTPLTGFVQLIRGK
ncbi:MAG: gliding motility-associated C-terminal domain-containing protein [Bacteroidetes bacterium]|nr:gliding motility-associated C-terminal domain-containing protein [Bacteroidota bacterium]